MNEIDLTKILKDCPSGTVLWSDNYGEVKFLCIDKRFDEPIVTKRTDGYTSSYTEEGWSSVAFPASCLLWPSKDCRDWSKFTAPWYKKEKFDPKTLQPFDKVLIKRYSVEDKWTCNIFSFYNEGVGYDFACLDDVYEICIPYNDDTKYLVGTTEEAPEYYRYWED